MKINTQGRSGGSSKEFKLLESDVYRCKIVSSIMEEDQFAEPNRDGTKPLKLVLRWEVTEATDEQDDDVVGCAVWQRFNPFYGTVREGGPSKFKAFIDLLREQGFLPNFIPNDFETDDLIDIEQRVNIEKYAKSMGVNAGQPGNRVASVLPLKRKKAQGKNVPQPVEELEDADLPLV